MKRFSAAVIALAFTTSVAAADSKSWATIKPLLPDNVNLIAGANLSALRGTSLYQSIVPKLIAREPDAKKAFELAKSTCAIDLHAAMVDATAIMGDDEKGVVVVALDKSIDQKRVLDCMQKVVDVEMAPKPSASAEVKTGGLKDGAKTKAPAAAPPPKPDLAKAPPPAAPKVLAKTTGKITEYGLETDSKRFYVAWLAPDVVAVATIPDDKALLEKMLGGKGAKGAITSLLTKAPSSSSIWIATTKSRTLPDGGGTMKGAFGTVKTANSNIDLDMSVVMGSAKEAKSFIDSAVGQIASLRGNVPASFHKLIDAMKLTAAADNANLKLVATEKDIMSVVALALMSL